MDNAVAIEQMELAYSSILARKVIAVDPLELEATVTSGLARDGISHPRIITFALFILISRILLNSACDSFGGDHTIVLPILRSLNRIYGPVSVIHFDAHIDTWPADSYPGSSSTQSRITHGTFFTIAHEEGLIANNSIHAGVRCKFTVSLNFT